MIFPFTLTAVFGLAMYTAQMRKREIGIRKNRASVLDITSMLTKDFGKLVVMAAVLATTINISIWVFAAAMIIALVIAMISVSYQSIKAATANPVNNLRTE